MRRILSAFALLLVIGCGGGGGGDKQPANTFKIQEDLNGIVYTYQVGGLVMGCIYEPTSNFVICIMDSSTTVPLAFFGPPASELSVNVTLAALDTDQDGNILEELSLPVAAGSRLDFAADGETVAINVTIPLDPSNPTRFVGTGNLISTGTGNARMARAVEWAQTVSK